jgi:predicted small lipoprotein YifL
MLLIRQILVRALVLAAGAVAAATLVGCGQRGPLYLPTEPAAANRATLPQAVKNSVPGTGPASAPAPEKTAP